MPQNNGGDNRCFMNEGIDFFNVLRFPSDLSQILLCFPKVSQELGPFPAHIAAMLGIIRYLKRMLQPRLLVDHINVQHRMILYRMHPTPRDTSKGEDIELNKHR